jgi:hypothetical protein
MLCRESCLAGSGLGAPVSFWRPVGKGSAPGALAGWLEFYNWRRPHGSLSHKPPGARLGELKRNNLVGSYT